MVFSHASKEHESFLQPLAPADLCPVLVQCNIDRFSIQAEVANGINCPVQVVQAESCQLEGEEHLHNVELADNVDEYLNPQVCIIFGKIYSVVKVSVFFDVRRDVLGKVAKHI